MAALREWLDLPKAIRSVRNEVVYWRAKWRLKQLSPAATDDQIWRAVLDLVAAGLNRSELFRIKGKLFPEVK